MTAEGVTKVGAGRRKVRDGENVTNDSATQDSVLPHRVIPVPVRSSPALVPSDVITGLVPVIPIGKAQLSTASGWPGQARP
jgi:hypothetical protein